MSFRDGMRRLLFRTRAIPGQLGLRPYRAYVDTTMSSGDELGQGTVTTTSVELTEANGQPPRVKELSAEEIALGGYSEGAIEIGPVTPDFPGGGTALSTLAPDPSGDNSTVRVRLVGPRWPSGANFIIARVIHDHPFGYRIIVHRSAD